MSRTFQVGDLLPPLRHTATTFQLFRYSAVTWNPHRIHFDETYAREEGHRGLALHSHLRAALALRCVTEGLGPGWQRREGRLPATQAGLRACRPGLHRPRHGGRRRRPGPRAHRGEPLRRGRVRRDGAGQQDRGRELRPIPGHHSGSGDMKPPAGRGRRPIRVGNCSGFYGDRASAMADMARAGGIDVLTGDYLAEVTMLILGKARAKDASKGYATTFLQHLDGGAGAPRRERDPARRQRRRAQPRRAGRGNPRTDRAPRLRPAGLPHRRRRRLRPPRRHAAGWPSAGRT